jgi:Thioredoxin
MSPFLVRLGVLALVALLLYLFVWIGRRFVETRRQQALAAEPLALVTLPSYEETIDGTSKASDAGRGEAGVVGPPSVRILAFSSDDCHQCHQLQEPALRRVREARGESVSVVEVDAPASPELTQRYHILTVPSTVILDAKGHARVINYGFANTQRLLQQVDEVLAKAM